MINFSVNEETYMQYAIFDIDGTLADCRHRLHHILEGEKDWPAFDAGIPDDPAIHNMVYLAQILDEAGITIILLTGRNERTRQATEEWLHKYGICYQTMLMRGYDDFRPASIIKVELLEEYNIEPSEVISIFEDEPKTVKTLRDLGFHVCDVLEWKHDYREVTGGR
jgi:FMN phosphatase YigB (HAD superfamily)